MVTNWCLQPSITQQWKGLRAWFLHCLTSLRSKVCLFANRSSYIASIMVLLCPPVLFTDNTRCQFTITWYGLPLALSPFFIWSVLDSNFLHCYSFVMLCNKQSIATNEAQCPPDFSVGIWLLGHTLHGFSPRHTFRIATGFTERSFLHTCNIATNEA